jgi:serine/threonine protein kinase
MPLERSSSDSWLAGKFAEEVKALALIDHPGVVGALDSGITTDGRPFLVMQYVEGRPLHGTIPSEGVPLERAADLLRQIGQALGAAHAKGICHRDLKPANIKPRLYGLTMATIPNLFSTTPRITTSASCAKSSRSLELSFGKRFPPLPP